MDRRVMVILAEGFEEGRLLELAALAESASSHPISKSLQKAYGQELDRSRVGQVEERSGAGVVAEVPSITPLRSQT